MFNTSRGHPNASIPPLFDVPVGVTPSEFRRDFKSRPHHRQCRRFWRHCRWCGRGFRHKKTRISGLSYGVVCVILLLAILVQCRLVTDTSRRTDERTDIGRLYILRCVASRGKNPPSNTDATYRKNKVACFLSDTVYVQHTAP